MKSTDSIDRASEDIVSSTDSSSLMSNSSTDLSLHKISSDSTAASITEHANISLYDVPSDKIEALFKTQKFDEFFKDNFEFLITDSDVVTSKNVLEIIGEAALLSKMEIEIIRYFTQKNPTEKELEQCTASIQAFKASTVYQNYYSKNGLVTKSKDFLQKTLGNEFQGFADNITKDMIAIENIKEFKDHIEYVNIIREKLGLSKGVGEGNLTLKNLSKDSQSIESLVLAVAFSNPEKMGRVLAAVDLRTIQNPSEKNDLIIEAKKSSKSINVKSVGLEVFSFCTFVAAGVAIGFTGSLTIVIGAIFANMVIHTSTNYIAQKLRERANKKQMDLDAKKFSKETNETFKIILHTIDANKRVLLTQQNSVKNFFLEAQVSEQAHSSNMKVKEILDKNSHTGHLHTGHYVNNTLATQIPSQNKDDDVKISIHDIQEKIDISKLTQKEECDSFFKNNFKSFNTRKVELQMDYKRASEIIGEAALLFKIKIEIMMKVQNEGLREKILDAFESSDVYQKYYGEKGLADRASAYIKQELGLEGIIDIMTAGMNNQDSSLPSMKKNIEAMRRKLGMEPGELNPVVDLNSIQNTSNTIKNLQLSILSSNPKNIGLLLASVDNRTDSQQKPNELILQAKKSTNLLQKCKDNYPSILYFALIVGAGACIGVATVFGGPIVAGVVGSVLSYLLPKANDYLNEHKSKLKSSNPLVEQTAAAKNITRVFESNKKQMKANKEKVDKFFKDTELPSNIVNVNELCGRTTQHAL